MKTGTAVRWLAVCIVAALLAVACSAGVSEDLGSSSSSESAEVEAVVPPDGGLLAEVAGVGEIREGFAVFGADDPEVSASDAGPVPELEGVLSAGPGLAGEVGTPFTGALQVRLDVPAPPTDEAIPVAVFRDAAGRVSIEPALWDPASSQMVVWATSFSDRWGAWFDPRNWVEEVVQVGQGAFDFVADFVTGRTDPPGCRNDPPSWSSSSTNEVSSMHVCAQADLADDGAERFELFMKSNRRTAQLVTIPSVAKDYLWTENLPDEFRRILTSLAGVDANTNTALLGTYAMSMGFRQPEQGVDFDVIAYQTPRIITANPVFALLGNLPLEGTIGVMAAVAKCHAEASGIDVTRFDATPDDTRPDVSFLEGMVRCAFEVLQYPELAFGIVQEVAGAIGLSNAAGLEKVNAALRSIAPTAARLASGLAIGSALTNLWDGIFDNLADGRITITLTGTDPVALAWTSNGIVGLPWGTNRQQVVDLLSAVLRRSPDETYDDVGGTCGPVTGSVVIWRGTFVSASFDLAGRFGGMSFDLEVVPHADGVEVGETFDLLRSAEPKATWDGPIEAPNNEPDYYEWTLAVSDTSVRGGLTGPPPGGMIESFVHLSGPFDPPRCGE